MNPNNDTSEEIDYSQQLKSFFAKRVERRNAEELEEERTTTVQSSKKRVSTSSSIVERNLPTVPPRRFQDHLRSGAVSTTPSTRRRNQYIPQFIIIRIAEFLSLSNLSGSLFPVNRTWYEACHDELVWQGIVKRTKALDASLTAVAWNQILQNVQAPTAPQGFSRSNTVVRVSDDNVLKKALKQFYAARRQRHAQRHHEEQYPTSSVVSRKFSHGITSPPITARATNTTTTTRTGFASILSANGSAGSPMKLPNYRPWKAPRVSLTEELSALTESFLRHTPTIGLVQQMQLQTEQRDILQKRLNDVSNGIDFMQPSLRTTAIVQSHLSSESSRLASKIQKLESETLQCSGIIAAAAMRSQREEYIELFERVVIRTIMTLISSGGKSAEIGQRQQQPLPQCMSTFVELELFSLREEVIGTPVSLRWNMVKRQFPINEQYYQVVDVLLRDTLSELKDSSRATGVGSSCLDASLVTVDADTALGSTSDEASYLSLQEQEVKSALITTSSAQKQLLKEVIDPTYAIMNIVDKMNQVLQLHHSSTSDGDDDTASAKRYQQIGKVLGLNI